MPFGDGGQMEYVGWKGMGWDWMKIKCSGGGVKRAAWVKRLTWVGLEVIEDG